MDNKMTIGPKSITTLEIPNDRNRSDQVAALDDKTREREIQLRKTSQDLEAVFLTQMFKAMEKTIPKDASLTGSKNTLSSMLYSSVMGKSIARQGGVGLADVIYKSLLEKEEIPNIEEINTNDFIEQVQAFRLLNDD